METPEIEAKRGAEILNISVEIGNGQKDILTICEHDDSRLVVRNFFIKNNITSNLEQPLLRRVHEFLAEVAEEHQLINMALASRPNFPTTPCKNYGEVMYLRGLERKEEFLVANQMKRIIAAKDIENTLTQSPVINKKSRLIASTLHSKSNSVLKFHTPRSNSISEPLFSPKINKKSEKMAKANPNRVNDLHGEAEIRKKRKELKTAKAKKSEFSFKPSIINKSKASKPEEVVDRLINSKKTREKNIEDLRKHLSICIDPLTGQKYFKPITGRAPESRRSCDSTIWESLYKQPRKSLEPQEDFPYSPTKLDGKVQTEKILLKKKILRFSQIFKQLNPNPEGKIRFSEINFNSVDDQLLKTMVPLLKELEETNAALEFEDFVDSMNSLLSSLNPLEKNIILAKKAKKIQVEHKPSHKKSASMASFQGLYTRQISHQQKAQARLEIEQLKLQKQETKDCTFRPSLTSRKSLKKKHK